VSETILTDTVDQAMKKLLGLRRQREKRDYWAYSKSLLDAADTLRKRFGYWTVAELADLNAQVNLLVQVSEGKTRERLDQLAEELRDIDERKLREAKEKLRRFVSEIKTKKHSKTGEVVESFVDHVVPSIAIVARLNAIRQEVDSLGDLTLAIGSTIEEITPEERRDVESSLQEIREGRAKQSNNVESVIGDLLS